MRLEDNFGEIARSTKCKLNPMIDAGNKPSVFRNIVINTASGGRVRIKASAVLTQNDFNIKSDLQLFTPSFFATNLKQLD
jgi:hypothetical protein